MADKGLMTVNVLLKKLESSILNNHALQKYLEIKQQKIRLENLILEQDFAHPDVPRIQAQLLHHKEANLIEEFMLGSKNFKRLISVLHSIEDQDAKHAVQPFIALFSFLENKNALNKLHSLAKEQSRALKHNRYNKFLKVYNQEKLLQYELMSHLAQLNLTESISEVIRVTKRKKMNVNGYDASTSIKGMVVIATILCIGLFSEDPSHISSATSWLGVFAATGVLGDLFLMQKVLDTERITHRVRLYQERAKLDDDTMELMSHLEKLYRIKIRGTLSFHELNDFKNLLEISTPMEVKKFLRAVYFRPKGNMQAQVNSLVRGAHVRAVYHPGNLTLDINTPEKHSMFHELAHARIQSLPGDIYTHWDEINRHGVPIVKLKQKVEIEPVSGGVLAWKELKVQPAFGYARAYSATNIDEDMATMADFIFDISEGESFSIPEPQYFGPYIPIYQKKAALLERFGVISQSMNNKFHSWVHKHSKYKIKSHSK